MRELLKRENEFVRRNDVHGVAFDKVKKLLSTAPTLAYYVVNKGVTLQCDASQAGIGCAILQDGRPVEFASRAMTNTEQSHAQIEKEMLAILFALERFHTYVYAMPNVKVETDHKPLLAIHKKALSSAPKRLQRMLLRTLGYTYELVYRPGTHLYWPTRCPGLTHPPQTASSQRINRQRFGRSLQRSTTTNSSTSSSWWQVSGRSTAYGQRRPKMMNTRC